MKLLSIVVPMLDERAQLPALLDHLDAFAAEAEILLVDGGSGDGGPAYARHRGFRVLDAPRGRARQMNAGAAATRGEWLLFLHADTRLPAGALGQIRWSGRRWGRFDVRIAGRSPWLAVVAAMMNLRSRLTGIATGDQAIFVRRNAFEAVGGFPDQPLMEDIELSRRLKRLGPPACLPGPALTSGRRWEENGVWRTIVLMWSLRLAYWLGADPKTLAARYR
ncbi:hypothetical protein MIT9_P1511 [Methylomarinovum caldicuralii]|uniref:Glycosyltransferase 2-like domain-containing protein n=1 Tax=Methylomarinovum caldicuralii TaxID=438856 RepID=A0AAU9C7E2_9GAMM|nr:TIGR04283 family arsenosugar biosynthesis glycosyltransferase [Methylomarinovum caldicuralii]BCX81929.1 hypothetical protein MIT9_P1511 [Methylomarinovum caldicuralii]